MAESFLEEQLKRIKEMTEQMSRIRAFRETPEVRHHPTPERSSAADEPPASRRRSPRHPVSRRRGR
jgi:hypothetical protein